MRHVASQKLVMNERQASSRTAAAAAGKDGHILLGGAAVPEAVLRGKGLRALLDAQQQAAGQVPVGGLIDGECTQCCLARGSTIFPVSLALSFTNTLALDYVALVCTAHNICAYHLAAQGCYQS
jgi:hypothetical protein